MALGAVRARIAEAVRSSVVVPPTLGAVTLRPHQVEAAALVLDRCRRLGGALLADPVGAGKTYTAIACAAFYHTTTVVAPAVLRDTWRRALDRTGQQATWHSLESLSRTVPPLPPPRSLVIVDEAHHARNPATRRYQSLARLTWGADVVLLTATPIHNSARDLEALVELFARRAPGTADAVTLRRSDPALPGMPRVRAVQWLENPATSALLAPILSLPPPLPADGAGHAHALGVLSLVRQWLSSQAALERSLRRRRLAAEAMQLLVERGDAPTLAAVRRCVVGDDALQFSLGFDSSPAPRPDEWHRTLARWIAALDDLLALLRSQPDADARRADAILNALRDPSHSPAIAFTHSAATAQAVFRRLHQSRRTAGIWGPHAWVASGRVPRADILERLRPNRPEARDRDPMRVDLLVSTDVLSEGVDLQAAGTLVHLDLPWTPARLEQRLGRLRRPGSPHAEVVQYAFRLPTMAERFLRLIRRLCDKARTSRTAAGIDLDTLNPGTSRFDAKSTLERALDAVRPWRSNDPTAAACVTACACAPRSAGCVVAVLEQGAARFLMALDGAGVTFDLVRITQLLEASSGAKPGSCVGRHATAAERRVRRWCREQEVLGDVASLGTPIRRAALRRLHEVGARAARSDRPVTLASVAHAVSLVRRAGGAGAERFLGDWLALGSRDLAAIHALIEEMQPRVRPADEVTRIVPIAILALVQG
ncbi:MAG: DEAD/DEAH box helicase [Gemmatimonadetes bacterium]|nr:DEAD/DEAH box helicase [Gemmatimonadota bacterium]